jgi:hypothetical protein
MQPRAILGNEHPEWGPQGNIPEHMRCSFVPPRVGVTGTHAKIGIVPGNMQKLFQPSEGIRATVRSRGIVGKVGYLNPIE